MGEPLSDKSAADAANEQLALRKVLLDDEQTRITYFRFGPGEGNEWHVHAYDFVVVTLDDGLLQSELTDGSVAVIPSRQNNFYKVPAGNRHRARNVGDKPIRLVEIELKSTDITQFGGGNETAGRAVPNLPDLIAELEQRRQAAMLAGDVATLDELLSESLVYTHSNAESDGKRQYLDKLASGALRYHTLAFDDTEVVCVGTDTVLTTGRMRGRVEVDGALRQLDSRFTTVWLRAQGFWRLVSFHAAPVPKA